jgi:hypothetical protein
MVGCIKLFGFRLKSSLRVQTTKWLQTDGIACDIREKSMCVAIPMSMFPIALLGNQGTCRCSSV